MYSMNKQDPNGESSPIIPIPDLAEIQLTFKRKISQTEDATRAALRLPGLCGPGLTAQGPGFDNFDEIGTVKLKKFKFGQI